MDEQLAIPEWLVRHVGILSIQAEALKAALAEQQQIVAALTADAAPPDEPAPT